MKLIKFIKKYPLLILVFILAIGYYNPMLIFLIAGLYLVINTIYYYSFLNYIKKNGIEAIGTFLLYTSDDIEGHSSPTIEFKSKDGKHIKKEPYYYSSTDLSKFRTYKSKINQPVTLLYDQKNPEKFIIKKESSFNYFTLILSMIVGIGFTVLSTLTLLEIISY